jgi:hypothetical protein
MVPCEKLNLKTSTPLSINASSVESDEVAGPRVATILALLMVITLIRGRGKKIYFTTLSFH